MDVAGILFIIALTASIGLITFLAYKVGYHNALSKVFGALAESCDRVSDSADSVNTLKTIRIVMVEHGLWRKVTDLEKSNDPNPSSIQ